MKDSTWNLLAIFTLAALVLVVVLFVVIFLNPQSALNPFPPEPLPTQLVLPTATPTYRQLPPTWTPTLGQGRSSLATLDPRPSSTLPPTSTSFTIPTFTATFTVTSTPTDTATPTNTPTRTPVPTATPRPTNTPVPTDTPEPTVTTAPTEESA